MLNIVPIVALIAVGVFLEAVFTGVIHALGYACVIAGVLLFIVWLIATLAGRNAVR
jgi:hypothetical protein